MYREQAVQGVVYAMRTVQASQARLDDAVAEARTAGATWAQIGDATGMSRQSAHERWGHLPRTGCQRADCGCVNHETAGSCDCGHGPGRGHRGGRGQGRGGSRGRGGRLADLADADALSG